ncbi:MAG: HAMP domain-containing sensor histidine kinase [Candidatus Ozemobacteraceae bacterium]
MNIRLLVMLALLVFLPLGLLSWLGFRAADEEYAKVQTTFQRLATGRLSEFDLGIAQILDDRRKQMHDLFDGNMLSNEQMERISRTNCFLVQCFSQASDGMVIFPSPNISLTEEERHFLIRTQSIFDQKTLLSGRDEYGISSNQKDGWHAWYWDSDIHLLYWRKTKEGGIIGGEVSRMRLLADIISILPETTGRDALFASGCVSLTDSQNRTLYRWGNLQNLQSIPDTQSTLPTRCSLSLSPPLRSWSLHFQSAADAFSNEFRQGIHLQLLSGLLVVGLTLFGLAFFLYREHTRGMLEAEQRVSFVNQVSHELKTPLTNIRMYAELLENELPEEDVDHRKRLDIIILETRRLGRLIGNVLSFAKHRKGKLHVKPRMGIPDQEIMAVMDNFRPALDARRIALHLDLDASKNMRFDADVLEQILGNLISNVEKYAYQGENLIVKTRLHQSTLHVWVRDFGPGIPADKRDFIFQPFTRLSDKVNEGASGTGIGLSIAREQAQLHGGNVELVFSNGAIGECTSVPESENPRGNCFLMTIVEPDHGLECDAGKGVDA